MLKVLRTYRSLALLTAFSLVGSAFAPLSSLCGMEDGDADRVAAATDSGPCSEMFDGESESASDNGLMGEDSAVPMIDTSCCVVKSLLSPKTEQIAAPTASIEVVSEAALVVARKTLPPTQADESPPDRSPVALHLLLGRFLI